MGTSAMDNTDMMIDMLVDDELPETERAGLLRSLSDAQWKELSVRFLQRQVEKKGVRQLIAAASIYPEDALPRTLPFPAAHRSGWMGWGAVAAGLLVAVASVAATLYVTGWRGTIPGDHASPIANASAPEFIGVAIPGNLMGDKESLQINVPVLSHQDGMPTDMFLSNDGPGTRNSVVIIRQNDDNAFIVPVATTNVVWN